MFFHKAKLAGYSSVVGQPIMLLNERGACIGQLSLIGYQGDDYKKAVADIADALNEITRLRAQLAKSEKTKMTLAGDKIDLRQELAEVKGKLAAAEADRLAAMEWVREAAASELAKAARSEAEINNQLDAELLWFMSRHIKTLDLDALAEGEK